MRKQRIGGKGIERRRAWRELNARLNEEFVRDHGYLHCEECGANEGAALSRHHVKFRSQGGTDAPENLRLLCAVCHGREHGQRIVM